MVITEAFLVGGKTQQCIILNLSGDEEGHVRLPLIKNEKAEDFLPRMKSVIKAIEDRL